MRGKLAIVTLITACALVCSPLQTANAANINISVHLYTLEGVAVGEFCLEDRVAFRLRLAKEGALPVIAMQKNDVDTIIAPDIANGMFMLRLWGE